jgi:molecular chaperone DnaK
MSNSSILAIDFGTTNSYFCKCPADQISPVGVDFGMGRDGIPTAILYRGDKEPLVGNLALHEYGEASNEERKHYNLCTQFKPDIARSEEAAGNAEDFLHTVLVQSQRQHITLDPAKNEVILGVPSEAEDDFRAKLAEIAKAAGYGDVKLVDEPKGALLCHLWHKDFSPDEARKGVLVVDFGGGTCDFAFLCGLEVRHSWGDMELGGRLFDDLFFQWFLDENNDVLQKTEQAGDTYYVHSYLCRHVKEFFSLTMARNRSESVNKSVGSYGSIRGMNWGKFLGKAKAYNPSPTLVRYLQGIGLKSDRLIQPDKPIDLIEWFQQSLTQGLTEKSIDTSDISRVILAGGSSQWPFISDVIFEALHIEPSNLMRSDRPYAVISEGLAILPALQKQFKETRNKLRSGLSQFCETKVRPLIQKITNKYVSDVAVDITSELFEKIIKPVLQEFRENGGSVASLKKDMSSKAESFEPQLKKIIGERMLNLRMGLPGQVKDLLTKWFESYGLGVGDAQFAEGRGMSDPSDAVRPEVPDLYGGIMDTIGWSVVAITTSIGAMVCGGAGTAILISGPIGLIVGIVLTSAIAFLTVRYGKEKAQRFAENWVAPAWVVKRVLTQSKIDKTHKDFQLQLENKLQEETATLQDEFETMIRKITELQIESLSEIAQL